MKIKIKTTPKNFPVLKYIDDKERKNFVLSEERIKKRPSDLLDDDLYFLIKKNDFVIFYDKQSENYSFYQIKDINEKENVACFELIGDVFNDHWCCDQKEFCKDLLSKIIDDK